MLVLGRVPISAIGSRSANLSNDKPAKLDVLRMCSLLLFALHWFCTGRMSLIGNWSLLLLVCCSIVEFHSKTENWVELAVAISMIYIYIIIYVYIHRYASCSSVAVCSIYSRFSLKIKSLCIHVGFKPQPFWAELTCLRWLTMAQDVHAKTWLFDQNVIVVGRDRWPGVEYKTYQNDLISGMTHLILI